MSNGYGSKPTKEGALLAMSIERPFGIEIQVADPRSSLARFYAVRKEMAITAMQDLQFRQIGPHTIWIMRKERRAELKNGGTNAEST